MTCTTSKEHGIFFKLTHEGTNVVKESKLKNLAIQFETITMFQSECFDDFYACLSDIVNTSFNLGEVIDNMRVVKKILRSLPRRFIPKVIVWNSLGNLKSLKLENIYEIFKPMRLTCFPKPLRLRIEAFL